MNAVLPNSGIQNIDDRLAGLDGADLIAAMVSEFGDQFVIVSSFGTESAVLLHQGHGRLHRDLTKLTAIIRVEYRYELQKELPRHSHPQVVHGDTTREAISRTLLGQQEGQYLQPVSQREAIHQSPWWHQEKDGRNPREEQS